MRVWIRQFVSLAFAYVQAMRWYKRANFFFNFMSIFGAVYILPAAGCGIVTGAVCVDLQWSGIVIGIIVSVTNGVAFALDLPSRITTYAGANIDLMQIARDIGLELERPVAERPDASVFSQAIMNRYDTAIKGASLPWYISGEQQFANINLLQNYLTPCRQDSSSSSSLSSSASEEEEPEPRIGLTSHDRAVMDRMEVEMSRLGAREVDVEIGKFSTTE